MLLWIVWLGEIVVEIGCVVRDGSCSYAVLRERGLSLPHGKRDRQAIDIIVRRVALLWIRLRGTTQLSCETATKAAVRAEMSSIICCNVDGGFSSHKTDCRLFRRGNGLRTVS